MSVRRRRSDLSEGDEGRVKIEPTITNLCLALVRATFTLLQSHSRLPTFCQERAIDISFRGTKRMDSKVNVVQHVYVQ